MLKLNCMFRPKYIRFVFSTGFTTEPSDGLDLDVECRYDSWNTIHLFQLFNWGS